MKFFTILRQNPKRLISINTDLIERIYWEESESKVRLFLYSQEVLILYPEEFKLLLKHLYKDNEALQSQLISYVTEQ